MTSSAISAYGVTLTRAGNAIAEITKMSSPKVKLDTIDVTSHASANMFREYIGGLLDGGEVAIEGNFISSDASGQIGLQADQLARTVQTFVLTFPTAITATWTFSALVTEFEAGNFAVDTKVPFTATLKVTGKPVLAITASNNITALTITTATLYPAFAAATYIYEATSTGTSVTVTATFAAGTATASNGTSTVALTSTVASSALALGSINTVTTITITVTETGKVPKIYTIGIAKTA